MTDPDEHNDASGRGSPRDVLALGAVLALLALVTQGWASSASVGAGAGVGALNHLVFTRTVETMLGRRGGMSGMIWRLVGAAKIPLLFGLVALLLLAGPVRPVAFIVGYGAFPLVLVLRGLTDSRE